ncbi:hypothetical protein SAXI111661_03020 [Saccharomonospora xinjiangensis]|uniref:YtxH domain-containing protein n=1 Tax=Saccharomonospora xinjiangensis XJ-54 TaxID=882086 RepID=I0UY92_9PSEU|nr:hypothetical protein [Saccharomonospora xinjiangensis]EID52845.1 hypothetical protein SacxiDRAFT_0573 [Saccharomonospora xinjiangensis XJ-54]QBQ59866.1 hypothetical protein EYD13_07500 [Saccharomonospora xinjiangensis]
MKMFLVGAAAGYVLGARAGRARYEQIVRNYRKLADHPAVQGAAGVARAKLGEKVGDRLPFTQRRHGVAPSHDGHAASGSRSG